jgi:hypothetical protein
LKLYTFPGFHTPDSFVKENTVPALLVPPEVVAP